MATSSEAYDDESGQDRRVSQSSEATTLDNDVNNRSQHIAELAPKLFKTTLPVIVLILIRYVVEYSTEISLYLCWTSVYLRISDDFSISLVHVSNVSKLTLFKELFWSLALLIAVVFTVWSSRGLIFFRLLYFSPYVELGSDIRSITDYLYLALLLDVVARSAGLCVRIFFCHLVPVVNYVKSCVLSRLAQGNLFFGLTFCLIVCSSR